jgi:hypothetical protein
VAPWWHGWRNLAASWRPRGCGLAQREEGSKGAADVMVVASGQGGAAMAAKWRLVSTTQSGRKEVCPWRLCVDVPIRPGEEKAKVVSCVSGSFVSVHVVQLRSRWR